MWKANDVFSDRLFTYTYCIKMIFLLFFSAVYEGPGANYIFPEDWVQYESTIPVEERGDLLAAYGKRLRGECGEVGKYFMMLFSTYPPSQLPLLLQHIINLLYLDIYHYDNDDIWQIIVRYDCLILRINLKLFY